MSLGASTHLDASVLVREVCGTGREGQEVLHRATVQHEQHQPAEQPEPELHAQNPAHCGIDQIFVELIAPDERGQVHGVCIAVHFHVDTGRHRLPRGLAVVGRQAVDLQLTHGVPVADDEAVEGPLLLKDLPDQAFVGRCRDAVDLTERRHDRGDASIDRGPEWPQVHVSQLILRHVGGGLVAAALDGAIACEVDLGEELGAGHLTLVSPYLAYMRQDIAFTPIAPPNCTILRFDGLERFGHWLTASTFVILALTGLNLVIGRQVIQPLIGEAVRAHVVLLRGRSGTEALSRELIALARRHLGPAIAPRQLLFTDALPKTPSGKIVRRQLRSGETRAADDREDGAAGPVCTAQEP